MNLLSSFATRRRFLRLIAGSPLLALAYAALPPAWKELVSKERRHRENMLRPAAILCPNCGQEMVFQSSANVSSHCMHIAPLQEQHLIESVEQALNVWDFKAVSEATSRPEHWAFLRGGVDDDATVMANRSAFQQIQIRVRRLGADVTPANMDRSVELYGRRWDTPLFLCPIGSLEAYRAEGDTGVARAARKTGSLMMQSTVSSHSYEQIAEGYGEPHWFQIYARPDWNATRRMIRRVKEAGCPALVWTIDLLGSRNPETLRRSLGTDRYNQPLCLMCHQHQPGYQKPMLRELGGPPGPRHTYDWDYVKRLKDSTNMKVILKGIVSREDAELAVEHGADGVYVSNHGGRAEESLRSTIEDLPEVVAGVNGRVPVFFDSGVRRGTDIFKALALGADAVGIGRPYVWGLSAFGEDGVKRVIDLLHAELMIIMRQAGTVSVDQITPVFVTNRLESVWRTWRR